MPNEKLTLVFDQGGHATRGVIFDSESNIIDHFESEISTRQSGDLIVEHSPEQMIESFHLVLNRVASSLGGNVAKISAIGMATQRSSFVCWDKNTGKALTPVISWQDRRTIHEMDRYESYQNEIHQKTGLYLNPHYGASKMRWCLDNIDVVQQAKLEHRLCIGPLSSFILFHLLSGNPFFVDPANASRTLMMNYKTLQWDEPLINLFSLSNELLPEIKPSKSNFGLLDWQSHRIPFILSTGDQSAAVYGAGKPDAKTVYVNVGTGAFVQNITNDIPEVGNSKLLASVVFTKKNKNVYALEGTVNGAGRALQWLAAKLGADNYEADLECWCEKYINPTLFLNGISGVGSPFWKADFKSRFIDDVSDHEKFVAVLESIVFLIYVNIKTMLAQRGNINVVSIAGGVAKSSALCQKLADLSGLIVERSEQSEATAIGVQFLMGGNVAKTDGDKSTFMPEKNSLLCSRFNCWFSYMV